ncbi:MAG: type-F conjugative transfer system secretin TraK [Sphingomonadaceae bacterium]|nr:type-F conjugative transfer system secretin TraK [Sphingomonadaceae bacterium]
MIHIAVLLTFVIGAVLSGRTGRVGQQWSGLALLLVSFFLAVMPAQADQTVMVEDNSRVDCVASKKDLTRVSLLGDEFASVSKIQPNNVLDDFSVVNEPTRGDIYISVPEGFRPKILSFFGTSKKGYVYKFACRVEPVEAQQIFLSNPTAEKVDVAQLDGDEQAPDGDETAVRLVQAMASQRVVPGYTMRKSALVPVKVGSLNVQLLAEYEGLEMVGRTIRIENMSKQPVVLAENDIAPPGAVAVAIANPNLAGGQVTTAYVVTRPQRMSP